jgi:catechol 2,3-dioxygenase-like lactoylglutathione lyase family enzyme
VTPALRPSHVGVCVTDLEASLRFWCDGLGFERLHAFTLDEGAVPGLGAALEVEGEVAVTSQMIRLGNLTVELIAYASPSPTGAASTTRGQVGLTHLSLLVDDVDAAAEHLVAHGGTLLPATRQDLGIQVVFLADPDGVRVELMQG